jgi:hypothetical protein
MADPIRLFAEFTDQLGTDYKLNIHQDGYGGSATEFNLGSDGFVLRYSGDNENRMQPIIGSEVTFTLTETVAQHTAMLTALATSEDADFKVSIFKDPDGANTLFWTGVLLHEQVELQDEAYPIQNTMNAVDELGDLKNVLYNDGGNAYTGRETVVAHLVKALNKTRALHVYGNTDVFLKYANDFKPTTFLSANALTELEVNHSAFYNSDDDGVVQFVSAFDVLQNFATTFNARVFFAEGYFWFVPIGAVKNNVTINVHTVTKAGTVSGSTSAVNTRLTTGSDIIKLRGGTTSYLPPLNKVQRTWKTDGNLAVVGPVIQHLNDTAQQIELGTNMTDDSLAYDASTVFRINFNYAHNYPGNGTSTGAADFARLALKMQIKVGSLYFNNALTFSGTYVLGDSNEGGSVAYTVTEMNFSAGAWSSSAGHFHIPLQAPPSYMQRSTGAFTDGYNYIGNDYDKDFSFDLLPLTSAQTGITVTVNIEAYANDGSAVTDVYDATAFGRLFFYQYVVNGGLTNGDRVVYEAITPDANQETLVQNDVFIGSSAFNDFRNLYENDSSPSAMIDSFASFTSASVTLPIHQLGVKEVLAGQNFSTLVRRGTVYKRFVSPLNTMQFSSRDFVPFETSFVADAVQTDYESFFLTSSDTNISVPDAQVFDDRPPVDDTEPTSDLRHTYEVTKEKIGPVVSRRFLQHPVRSIAHRATLSNSVTATDSFIFNTWTGGNGTATLSLPTVTGNEGRVLRFQTDSTIAANKIVAITPNSSDSGVTIDGASTYNLNRDYDGVSILCHASNWYIIQKKEK